MWIDMGDCAINMDQVFYIEIEDLHGYDFSYRIKFHMQNSYRILYYKTKEERDYNFQEFKQLLSNDLRRVKEVL